MRSNYNCMSMKKKGLSLLLCAALSLSLAACSTKPETPAQPTAEPTAIPVTAAPETTAAPTETPAAENRNVPVISVRCENEDFYTADNAALLLVYACAEPSVSMNGNDAAAAAINEALHKQYTDFAVGAESGSEYSISGKENYLAAAKEELARQTENGDASGFSSYSLMRQMNVRYNARYLLSITYDDTSYLGGAHGYTGRCGHTFDIRTGRELTLADLTDNYDAFLSAAVDQLKDIISYGAEYAAYGLNDGYEDQLAGLFRDGNWYFNDEGLVLMANPYELAGYAAGLIEFTLPYAWLAYQIKADYLPAESEADGTLTGELSESADAAGNATYVCDTGTGGLGACVTFTASGTVENVELNAVTYLEYSNTYRTDGTLWYAGRLADGESVCVQTWIPDVMPNLAISWRDADGEHVKYISQSGMDGSLILMDGEQYAERPLNISGKSVYHYDINGDYAAEEITVTAKDAGGINEYTIAVNGTVLDRTNMPVGDRYDLWICDLDGDGICELLFAADPGSDDYRTCGWHGDTLEPIQFTGDARYGKDPNGLTGSLDGRVVFSGGIPMLEAWYYQLGTYCAVIGMNGTSDGVVTLDPSFKWNYRGSCYYLTVAKILPVYLDEGGTAVLTPGEKLLLTGTDGQNTFFRTDDGRTGSIRLEYDGEGGWTINGESEENFFEMLPYVG